MKGIALIVILLASYLIPKCQVHENFHYKLPYAETGNTYNITSNSAYTTCIAYSEGCKLVNNQLYVGTTNPPVDIAYELTINSSPEIIEPFQMTGLSSSTTYYYYQKVTNCFGVFQTPVYNFTTTASGSTPEVTTTTASSITSNSASTGGNVISDGGSSVTERGVYYSTSPSPVSGTSSGSGTGSYTTNLSSLSPATKYYYRAYAVNSIGTGFGSELDFTTDILSGVPTISTIEATNISESSALTGGSISYNGNSGITEAGVCYSTGSTPTTSDSKSTTGTTQGGFYTMLSQLNDNTTYYYRAYAINDNGTGYGSILNFTTLNETGLATVTTTAASNITTSSVVLGGNVTNDGGSSVVARGVCIGTSPNPTTGSSSGTGTGSFSYTQGQLTPGTTYYYRAYAVNSTGINYGTEYSFQTLIPTSVPIISTLESFNITTESAIAGGSISYNGNSGITESGVCYSESSNPTIFNSKVISGATQGGFYVMLSDLNENTKYYYRAYATNVSGTGYGEILNFTTETKAASTIPTVTATNMTSTGVTYATSGGIVDSDGGESVTQRGIVWNTTGNPSLYNYTGVTSDGVGDGAFSSSLNNLTCGTTYYVKAYAVNSVGTAYSSNTITFTTSYLNLNEFTLLYKITECGITYNFGSSYPNVTLEYMENVCDQLSCPAGSTSGLGYKVEGNPTIGSQLYPPNTCSKSTATGWYLRVGSPVYIVHLTNGIIDYYEPCN